MTMDLKALELFVRVAALGAIGKAGAEVGLSRTVATQRIQALETFVGAQLLHRTTRSVSLTVDGEAFLEHAHRILNDIDEAIADVHHNRELLGGELRVASSASFGRKVLTPYVAEFLELHPRISVRLEFSDSLFDIVEHGFDLAVRLGSPPASTLKFRRIGASPRLTVASPAYLARHGTPIDPSDLKQHNCLIRSDLITWTYRDVAGQMEDIKISGNFSTNLAEAITEAAVNGVGIARKCRWEVADLLESGDLVELFPHHTVCPEWSIFTVRSPSAMPPARIRAFTDFIAKRFKSDSSLSQ